MLQQLRKEKFWILLGLGIAISVVVFAKVLDNYWDKEGLALIDVPVNQYMVGIRTPFVNKLMLLVTMAGNWQMLLWGSILGTVLLIAAKKWRYLEVILVGNSVGLLFTEGTKLFINRMRPPVANALITESGRAFPSGHSYFAVVFYGLLAYFWFKHFKSKTYKIITLITAIISILLLAFSRIYLGVHWMTDVLAGLSSSGAWLLTTIAFLEYRYRINPKWADYNQARVKDGIVTAGVLWLGAWLFLFWWNLQKYRI